MYRIATLTTALLLASSFLGQTPRTQITVTPLGETPAPGHLVIVYRNGVVPANADAIAVQAGAHVATHLPLFGSSALVVDGNEDQTIARLRSRPEIAQVLHDRYVRGHALYPLKAAPAISVTIHTPAPAPFQPISLPRPTPPVRIGILAPAPVAAPDYDTYYNSPQSWAVQQSGGYGDNVQGSSKPIGPWNTTLGAGVRIAVLDSGVDEHHPDIAPNLALNLSEVNQSASTGLPSPCDDGSPQDQQGHGTWVASLAAAALGPNTGDTIGVAPQATLLNIKVLERVPGSGATLTARCEAGQTSGLLSWVLAGIQDAVANHANVISISLGTLVDITTGDGAGWQAQFNAATYAAAQAGTVIVAALGNDGLNLSPNGPFSNFVELPAQSRSVLPVVASTNPACAENLAANATCAPGPVTRPYYSNYGVQNAIAAPGGSYPEGTDTGVSGFVRGACSSGLPNTTDGLPANGQSFGCFNLGHTAYVQAMGTSAAAPLVAGAAALLQAAHPNWTAAQIITKLQTSATHTESMTEPQLNLSAALTAQ